MKSIMKCVSYLQKAKKLKPEYDAGLDNDVVNHPKHYEEAAVLAKFEPIDLARRYSFAIGNAIKYILRAPYKGHEKLDLEKARFYLNDWLKFNCTDDSYVESSSATDIGDIHLLYTCILSYKINNPLLNLLFNNNKQVTATSVRACLEAVDKKIKEYK